MVINYQDKNLIVMYLQIYLAEFCGLVVHKVIPRSKKETEYYEITSNDPLTVTGYYDVPTYTALALYMAYNYPNEGYPKRWSKNATGEWSSEDYVYQDDQEDLVKVISENMKYVTEHKECVQVPERVLSYIFNEVVTPESSPEEVLRVKQMIYDYIYADEEHPRALSYTDDLFNTVVNIQKEVINKYTVKYVDEVQEIIMDYQKDENGHYILDENGEKIPVKTYFIGSQLNKVSAKIVDDLIDIDEIDEGKSTDTSVVIYLDTSEVFEANVIYEEGSSTETQDATSFVQINDREWQLNFDTSIGTITQLKVSYSEDFEYDIITGNITFFDYVENRKIEVTKNVNKEKSLPAQFSDYKITGYVDPWTEIIIKEGYEDGDN